MTDRKGARERAEAKFTKKAAAAEEGSKAKADYEAEGQATRSKTARLRTERLAREAAGEAIDRSLKGAGQPPDVRAERKKKLTKMPSELKREPRR